jgi:hypothetical protein
MKTFCLATIILLVVISFSAFAQEKGEQIIQLPQLSLEQKLDRSVRNTTTRDIVGIAYAKSLGKTPEDYGKYIGGKIGRIDHLSPEIIQNIK